jgi:hypothetical protein
MNRFKSFARRIDDAAVAQLRALAGSSRGNWFKDLLALWKPSGHVDGRALRLAVRSNYLNFYFRGQSVARVCFGPAQKGRTPRLETHIKYVGGFVEGDVTAQEYVSFVGVEGSCRARNRAATIREYGGLETLNGIIAKAGTYRGDEKCGVDAIVGTHSSLVDLEIAIPAWAGKEARTADRIDLANLEPDHDGYRLVFWEAKTSDDARLRAADGHPSVVAQLERYARFLRAQGHQKLLTDAYTDTCRILVLLHELATQSNRAVPSLGQAIHAVAAGAELRVDICPRLAVFDRPNCSKGPRVGSDTLTTSLAAVSRAGYPVVIDSSAATLRLHGAPEAYELLPVAG